MLCAVRRVLKPGGEFHMLDFEGPEDGAPMASWPTYFTQVTPGRQFRVPSSQPHDAGRSCRPEESRSPGDALRTYCLLLSNHLVAILSPAGCASPAPHSEAGRFPNRNLCRNST